MLRLLFEVLQTIQRDSTISFPFLGIYDLDPPAYFMLFGRPIYFYGVLIATGFLVAIAYCSRSSRRFGIKSDDFYDLMLWLIPIVIVCARLYFVLFRLEDYKDRPLAVFAVWEGGLAIYGGIIGGVLTAFFVCRHKKIPVPAMLDLCVYGLLIGQIIGRWGNFMNREAFGAETTVFCRMGLTDPGGHTIYVHPTFLYESLWNLIGLIFLIVWERKGKRRYDGQAFLLYLLWYGLGRAWIEGLRTDSLYIGSTGIRVSQLLSVVLALSAAVILWIQSRKEHPREALYVHRAALAAGAEAAEPGESAEAVATADAAPAEDAIAPEAPAAAEPPVPGADDTKD